MSKRNLMNRILPMLLVLVMVFGMVPFQAFAADNAKAVDATVIFTDLHTGEGDYKESTVKGIMTAFKNAGLPISSVTSGGDSFSSNENTYTAYTDTITGYIRSVLGTNMPVNYVWSDHDRGAVNNSTNKVGIDKTSRLVYGAGSDGAYGTADDGNYYVYALSMADLCTYDRYSTGFNYTASSNNRAKNGYTSTVPQAIENFLADAARLNKDRPLFIVSHQPLFDNRNDNGWAEDWCNAINEVGTKMDVAFFYGHNHKYDSGSDYYYAKGSTMPVATRKFTDGKDWNYNYQVGSGWQYDKDLASVNKVLNFTHMCAGYLSPATESGTTRKGTAMAIAIYPDSIRYTTYNSGGVYNGSYAVDKTVPREFAATEPELVVSGTDRYFVGSKLDLTVYEKVGSKTTDVTAKASVTGCDMNTAGDYTVHISYGDLCAEMPIIVREKTFRDDATGITAEVSTPGATALTVGDLAADSKAFQAVAGLLSSAACYTISMADCAEAALTLPVPAGVTTPVVYHISDDGETIVRVDAKASADGKSVTFTTGSFGAYIIGQQEITEDLENSLVAGGTSYADKTVYVCVDAFENGGKYLIIGEDAPADNNPNPVAFLNNNGNEGKQIVTIQQGSVTSGAATYNKGYIELNNTQAVWTASGSAAKGFTLSNNGKYIGGDSGNIIKGTAPEALAAIYDASAVRLKTASGTTKYLYYSTYSGEDWKWDTSINSSSSSRQIWIYKEMTVQVPTSTAVTYTVKAENVHHVLSTNTLQLQYSLLANGAAAEMPQGASYSFEVKNDSNGIIKSISDTGLVTFTKTVGGCYVKIACTWDGGTVYKYVRVTTEADPNACDHSYESVTVEATCTADGSVTYTCACGDIYVEVIKAHGHDYISVVTVPTCTEAGYTIHTCASCGCCYTSDQVAALGHSYTAVVLAPTCIAEGYTVYTCACGDSYTADQVAALGHSYKSVTVEATCTADGSVTYTCHCGDRYAEVIKATGHDHQAAVTAPTCTEAGCTTYTCACGDSYTADEVAALGHSYTCTDNGDFLVYTCSNCGASYTEVLARGWVKAGSAYVLDTDGIDVGAQHKYVVVGATQDYAMTLEGDEIGHAMVTIEDNILTWDKADKNAFYFYSNTSREKNTYLLTQDSSNGVCHDNSELKYGQGSKGYWNFGSGSNGAYQLYDYDNSANWYLNYGSAWSNSSVDRFAASSSARYVRLFKYTDIYVRLAGSLHQIYTTEDGATADSVLKKLNIENSTNGSTVSGAISVTADMVSWNTAFNGNVPGVYTATVTYQGAHLGTIQVTVSNDHTYVSQVIAPTCTAEGYTVHTCTDCGYTKIDAVTQALGHDYGCVESAGYLHYTCTRCSDAYSEKAVTYVKASGISAGESYVIAMYSGSKYYALSHAGNTLTAVEISVSNGEINSEISRDLLWSYTDNRLGYEDNGTTYRLYGQKVTTKIGTLSISASQSSSVSFSSNRLKINNQYLRYINGDISLNASAANTYLFTAK